MGFKIQIIRRVTNRSEAISENKLQKNSGNITKFVMLDRLRLLDIDSGKGGDYN